MRRAYWVFGAVFAVVATVGACANGSGEQADAPAREESTTEVASSPRTLPEQGPLDAGEYRTKNFEPAFTFEVGEGWVAGGPELDGAIFLIRVGERALIFASPEKVFDPKEPAEEREIPAPDTIEGWVDWHQENRYLDVSGTEPATIGGASGRRFHLEVASAPNKATEICGAPCVPGYPVGPTAMDYFIGYEEQDSVLDVGGETVIISVTAPKGNLGKFLPQAQKVLDTVEWKGS